MSADALTVDVLIVSTNVELARLRKMVLDSAGCRVHIAQSKREALALLEAVPFDVLVICHSVSGASAEQFARQFRERNPHGCIVYVAATPYSAQAAFADLSIAGVLGPEVLIEAVKTCEAPAA